MLHIANKVPTLQLLMVWQTSSKESEILSSVCVIGVSQLTRLSLECQYTYNPDQENFLNNY